MSLDPVLMAVIANRLDTIVREMENTLLRTGRSAVLNMARDFSCALITGDNRLLASAEGLPVHVIGMEFLAEAMTTLHDDIREGDAYLHNDPYLGNTHPADHVILVPVFVEGVHLFTAAAKAHQADCGNCQPHHLHALCARHLRGRWPHLPGGARAAGQPGQPGHHQHLPPPHSRAGPVVRRLPGDGRLGTHRRKPPQGPHRQVRRGADAAVHRGVVRLFRAAGGARHLADAGRAPLPGTAATIPSARCQMASRSTSRSASIPKRR